MSGCRAINEHEYEKVKGTFEKQRDYCLFVLGTRTGFRISELLSIKLKDVYQNGSVVSRVKVKRGYMKGKNASREVVLHPEAREVIRAYLSSIPFVDEEFPLFKSRMHNEAISRQYAHTVLKKAFKEANLEGCLATHTLRKSFASRVYANTGHDLIKTQQALGHSSITTTINYLTPNQSEIDEAILK